MTYSIEQEVNKQLLLHMVQRHMFCDISGKILDVDDAVFITGNRGEEIVARHIMTGDVWDDGKARVEALATEAGFTLEVIDGRELL